MCRKCVDEILTKTSKCPECKKHLNGIMNKAEKTIQKQKQTYEEMVKTAIKDSEMAKVKKASKPKQMNSLDVFI